MEMETQDHTLSDASPVFCAVKVPAVDEAFIAEAIRRATVSGYLPALGQRDVVWTEVAEWTARVQRPGFRWLAEHEHPRGGTGYIIIGNNGAIASGQHRILGGLMGDKPVPAEACSVLPVALPTQEWIEQE